MKLKKQKNHIVIVITAIISALLWIAIWVTADIKAQKTHIQEQVSPAEEQNAEGDESESAADYVSASAGV